MIEFENLLPLHQSILHHLSHGCTANEIATSIGITTRGVNWHLQVLYSTYNLPPGKNRFIKLLRAAGFINDKTPTE